MECLSCITYKCINVVYEKYFFSRCVSSVSGLYLHLRDTALNIKLTFDMCRWLVEGEDVEGVHGRGRCYARHPGYGCWY